MWSDYKLGNQILEFFLSPKLPSTGGGGGGGEGSGSERWFGNWFNIKLYVIENKRTHDISKSIIHALKIFFDGTGQNIFYH